MTLFCSGEPFPDLYLPAFRACCLILLILCSPASTADKVEELSVTYSDGEYRLQITDVLDAPVEYVYRVITDYIHEYLINPTITDVQFLPSGNEEVIRVRNISKHCIGPFCFPVVWTGDIVTTSDGDIEVKTIPELSDFESGHAVWHIRPQGNNTRLIYESRLNPAFFIPPVIGEMLIKKHIKDETLNTFRNIEYRALTVLALDNKQRADDLKKLSKRRQGISPRG
jgi:hypothetical protein